MLLYAFLIFTNHIYYMHSKRFSHNRNCILYFKTGVTPKNVHCPSIYGFWLPLWYLKFTDSDYLFGILDLQILITSLVSSNFSYTLYCFILQNCGIRICNSHIDRCELIFRNYRPCIRLHCIIHKNRTVYTQNIYEDKRPIYIFCVSQSYNQCQ